MKRADFSKIGPFVLFFAQFFTKNEQK